MSQEAKTVTPVMNYKLRSIQDGQWLMQLSVSKNGVPVNVINWDGVAAHADQYKCHPQFLAVEASAWIGSANAAKNFQRILMQCCGIQTDIVERT
jgi:hypothetical protein